MSNVIIGLTGGIGSGKTTIANLFSAYDIDVIDADIIARQVVEPGSQALTHIRDHFGKQVITADGQLDRASLRDIVFKDTNKKEWLNNLLHPLIRQEMISQCQQAKSPYCLLCVPLLIENGLNTLVNKVLVVDVDVSTQLQRTMQRDNNSKEQVQRIIDSQIPREKRLLNADDIINNEQTLAQVSEQVTLLHQKYLALTESCR